MDVREIQSEDEWEKEIEAVSFRPFAQSFVWGEFQASLGRSVKRFFIEERGELLAAVQLQFEKRPLVGGYWFAPKGPVFTESGKRKAESILEALRKYAKIHLREGVFLRIEPMISEMNARGWERKKSLNPSSTRRLDLRQTDEELLADMRQKTRYNIRISEKKQVETSLGDEADLPEFLSIMKETASRGAFIQRSDAYLQDTFHFLKKHDVAKLRLAEHEEELIAAQLEIWYGDTVTYLYGASSSEKRNVMAPYALHWATIQEAKGSGFHWYDFWGENPEENGSIDYKPSWKGISRFKAGFGGEHVEFAGTFDTPIKPLSYNLLRVMRRI